MTELKKVLNTKLNKKKGFTLAELLVVVAIIAVLVAIAIPVFGGTLTKAQNARDLANVRAAYAELLVEKLTAAPNASSITIKLSDIKTESGVSGVTYADHVFTVADGYTFTIDDDVTIDTTSTT